VFDTAARLDPGRQLLRADRLRRAMPFVQHGGEFARVAGSVTARTDAQKMAANSVELAAWSRTIPRDNDAAFGKEIGPTVPLSQVKRRNQKRGVRRLPSLSIKTMIPIKNKVFGTVAPARHVHQ